MKLYWRPHTCAIGIHILLEEIGRSYETEKLDVSGGATHEAAFLRAQILENDCFPTIQKRRHASATACAWSRGG
jgi:hypothetical protein